MTAIREQLNILHGEVSRARGTEASVHMAIDGIVAIIEDAIQDAADGGASDEQLASLREFTDTAGGLGARMHAAITVVPSPDGTVPNQPPAAGPYTADPAPDHSLDPFAA